MRKEPRFVRRRRALAAGLLALALAIGLAAVRHWKGNETAARPASEPVARTSERAPATTPARPRGPHNDPVPILMYHVVAPPLASVPYPELYVRPETFAAHVAMLARHGFHAVTLDQVYRYWVGIEKLPSKPIVFSFDDGYRSHYVNALPVLKKHGWPGVINLETRNMHISWGLSPRLLRKLIAAGWEIDSHTISHLDLTTLGAAELAREVGGSRRILQKELGQPVNFLCYPSGRYDETVIAAVEAAGYRGATTTEPGLARPADVFKLARVRVNGSDSAAALADRLRSLGVKV
jgi:peptidoglycan/xylan/chitin deacetylase (PgdA/CDA1 family)